MMKEIKWNLSLMLEKMVHELLIVIFIIIWLLIKTKFQHLEHYDGGSVIFGNNEPCCIKGKGSISLTNDLRCDNAY